MNERVSLVNGLLLDRKTGNIRMGRGATGWFAVYLSGIAESSIDTNTDIVLFIIAKNNESESILKKRFPIDLAEDGRYEINISLTNAETRDIDIGKYVWNGIIITGPEYDADGNVIVEDSDCVVPFYIDGDRPTFSMEEVGHIV